jgi:hypothetical protein
MHVEVDLPSEPLISLSPTLVARVGELKRVPRESMFPITCAGLLWGLVAGVRALAQHGLLLIMPVKLLGGAGALLVAGGYLMQYHALTFATAAISFCFLASACCGAAGLMEENP